MGWSIIDLYIQSIILQKRKEIMDELSQSSQSSMESLDSIYDTPTQKGDWM